MDRPSGRSPRSMGRPGGARAPTIGRVGTSEQSTTGGPEASWAGRVAGLAGACHPGPVVAVTALMAALAVTAGQSAARCVLTAAAVLTGQLSVGWCNDAFDACRTSRPGAGANPSSTAPSA